MPLLLGIERIENGLGKPSPLVAIGAFEDFLQQGGVRRGIRSNPLDLGSDHPGQFEKGVVFTQ